MTNRAETQAQPEAPAARVLAGLERELVEATDEEIVEAAADLGMNVKMKGSAAFIGVKYTSPKRFEDIFDAGELRRFYAQSFLPQTGRKDADDDEK